MNKGFPKAFGFCLFTCNLISILCFQNNFEISFYLFNLISVLITLKLADKIYQSKTPTLLLLYLFCAIPYLFFLDSLIPFYLRLIWLTVHLVNYKLIETIASDKKIALIFAFSPFILFETVALGHPEELLVLSVLLLVIALKQQSKILYSLALILSACLNLWALPVLIFLIKKRFLTLLVILSTFIGAYFFLYEKPSIYLICNIEFFGDYKFFIITVLIARTVYLFFLGGNLQNQIRGFYQSCLFLLPIVEPNMVIIPIVCTLSLGNTYKFVLLSCTGMGLHFTNFEPILNDTLIFSILFIVSLLLPEIYIRRFIFRKKGPWMSKISIITPVYNEEKNISELSLNLLQENHLINEWIIVDAGSKDSSEMVAKKAAAKFLKSPKKGRGEQIRYGIEQAKSEWVLILHADTRLSSNALSTLQKQIHQYHGVVGGAFKMCYRDYAHLGPLFILNDLKTRLFKVSFGDQSQFLKINHRSKQVPFPALALMEDVEVSMSWLGKPSLFIDSARSSTSSRRWREKGRVNNSVLIIKLLFHYFLIRQLCDKVDVQKLYSRYYS